MGPIPRSNSRFYHYFYSPIYLSYDKSAPSPGREAGPGPRGGDPPSLRKMARPQGRGTMAETPHWFLRMPPFSLLEGPSNEAFRKMPQGVIHPISTSRQPPNAQRPLRIPLIGGPEINSQAKIVCSRWGVPEARAT